MRRARQAIASGVHQLASVFLHVQALDSDLFQIGVFSFFSNFHLDPTLLCDRLIELRDLIVLRKVWIKILLAIEFAVFSNIQVQRHRSLNGVLEHFLIQNRKRAWQSTNHRIDMGVGVIPVSRGSGRENLAVGAQLHMGLKTDHGLPRQKGCCSCRHQL